jgi:hypothetical protein
MLGPARPRPLPESPPRSAPPHRHAPPARAGLLAPHWPLGAPACRHLRPPVTPTDPQAHVLPTEHPPPAQATRHASPWTHRPPPPATPRAVDHCQGPARRAHPGRRPTRVQGQTGGGRDPRTTGTVACLDAGVWRRRLQDHPAWGTTHRVGATPRRAKSLRRGRQGPCVPPTMARRGGRRQAPMAPWCGGGGVARQGQRPRTDPPPWEDACHRAPRGRLGQSHRGQVPSVPDGHTHHTALTVHSAPEDTASPPTPAAQDLTPAVSRANSRSEARAEAVGVGSSALLGAVPLLQATVNALTIAVADPPTASSHG